MNDGVNDARNVVMNDAPDVVAMNDSMNYWMIPIEERFPAFQRLEDPLVPSRILYPLKASVRSQ